MICLISIIIPTLNSEKVLEKCLESIRKQDYPQNKIQIIISDGGSTDKTLTIAKNYDCLIVKNPLKTAEAGKAIGLKKATGELIVLIDSDNILPDKSWLKKMLLPLKKDKRIIGSEPWAFTYRKEAGFIERYSALIGANDPYAFVCGITDRLNYINYKWTNIDVDQTDENSYILIKFIENSKLPTIGANGTIYRHSFLKKLSIDNYLYDIDLLQTYLNNNSMFYFAKVKTSIIHTFCESSVKKFIRKQLRRVSDFYTYKKHRKFNWSSSNQTCIPKFIFYSLIPIFPLVDSLRGFFNKPDIAWFFHPIACLLSLYVYVIISIRFKLKLLKPLNRSSWQQ